MFHGLLKSPRKRKSIEASNYYSGIYLEGVCPSEVAYTLGLKGLLQTKVKI